MAAVRVPGQLWLCSDGEICVGIRQVKGPTALSSACVPGTGVPNFKATCSAPVPCSWGPATVPCHMVSYAFSRSNVHQGVDSGSPLLQYSEWSSVAQVLCRTAQPSAWP